MAITCGHCHEKHDNIDAVMICASKHSFRSAPRPKPVKASVVQCLDELRPVGALWGWNDAGGTRPLKPSEIRRTNEQRDLLTQINELGRQITPGRYAIQNASGPNDIAFYHVERPEHGKWAGKTFVKQQISDELQRLSRQRTLAALVAIAADPRGASALYGQHIGVCGVCGRTLTNEDSRRAGIGPVCRQAQGW
jgi:hypothetical protein